MLTTVKHFPGHGDTAVDSHLQLATIEGDRSRLASVELLPFRAAIAAGVDSVMLGHIAVPALDPSGAPSTLSEPVATELLRREMGFRGLVVTDAMEMSGVRSAWTGEAAVRAVRAGADMILLPPDPEVAIESLVRAVREEGLAESRIDASVQRILETKERLGLDRQRLVDPASIGDKVGRPEDVERALDVARRSITVVRNDGGVLPLRAESGLRLLHLVLSSDATQRADQGIPEAELAARRIPVETRTFGPEVSAETIERLAQDAAGFSHVVISAFVRVTGSKGTADMAPSQARLVDRLGATGRPLVVVSYGSPYLIRQFPNVPAYVCAYGGADSSQRAAVAALLGEQPVSGRLPVTIPDLYPRGHGMTLPRHEMRLRTARPEDAGFRAGGLQEVDGVLDRFLSEKAFPGGVLAVGKGGALVHLRPFGRLSYQADAPAVQASTIYDLASLTKVIATTTMAMILVDEGKLALDKPVRDFIPPFMEATRTWSRSGTCSRTPPGSTGGLRSTRSCGRARLSSPASSPWT